MELKEGKGGREEGKGREGEGREGWEGRGGKEGHLRVVILINRRDGLDEAHKCLGFRVIIKNTNINEYNNIQPVRIFQHKNIQSV
jgi:hypothetical protein